MKNSLLALLLFCSNFLAGQTKLKPTRDSALVKFLCVDQNYIPEDSAYIQIFASDGSVAAKGYSDINGRIAFLVLDGATYTMKATKYKTTKDLAPIQLIKTPNTPQIKNIRLKINFYDKEYSEKYELAVFFDTDEHTLDLEDQAVLEDLYQKLKSKPLMQIEIAAHTDNVGSDSYNMALSQRRANSVRNYLLSRGIDESRVFSKGYGETEPKATNDTAEGRAKNRRVEVRVLAK